MAVTAGRGRRGKGADAPPPPEDGKGAATAGPAREGHNHPDANYIRKYAKDLMDLDASIAVLKAKRTEMRTKARGDGVVLGLVDRRIKRQSWTPQEIKADWHTERYYAECFGQPIGSQAELYGNEATPDALKEELIWRARGRSDGLLGRGFPEQPPEGCPAECRKPYAEGWEGGQKESQQMFLAKAEPAGAA